MRFLEKSTAKRHGAPPLASTLLQILHVTKVFGSGMWGGDGAYRLRYRLIKLRRIEAICLGCRYGV